MKVKTSELTPSLAFDWAVAECEGKIPKGDGGLAWWLGDPFFPASTDWAFGGPIIEREKINLRYDDEDGEWVAGWECTVNSGWGDTPLIAAMRCYVASKLGDEVELPEELKGA
jgi:hypothetical protein